MPLKLLCLHGWGTNTKILQSQLNGLMTDLRRDNTVTFHFLEGDVDSIPGPGISGFYDGPYYSYYKFPRSISDNGAEGESLLSAYDRLYDVVDEEGSFDGVLGFSHGGTLAAGFLIHRAKLYPQELPLFRCAIFINSIPPFRMDPGGTPVIDPDLNGYINIPTVSIGGAEDPLLEYSLELYRLCNPSMSTWVVHSKGHDIPADTRNVSPIAAAIRKLAVQTLAVW
ncbi:serine hydrolase FSH [Aspergillus minisclerotigenes]|uniref:Serine hydrolase FSH n=1 Tax=Aspergillus minisclerotigenes TaxID=656917 RepID=A0A5N6IYZ9_9EURO|nr:serine hydrolase FSH [Aspergillus minisclerotigenes]